MISGYFKKIEMKYWKIYLILLVVIASPQTQAAGCASLGHRFPAKQNLVMVFVIIVIMKIMIMLMLTCIVVDRWDFSLAWACVVSATLAWVVGGDGGGDHDEEVSTIVSRRRELH